MILMPPDLRLALRANAVARPAALRDARAEPDPIPVLKLFNPIGAGTWLATELDPDGDTLFGLADLGFGCPELGSFSLGEIARLRLPFGVRIERDLYFATPHPLSLWAETARVLGSIRAAEQWLAASRSTPLPSGPDPDGSGRDG